MKHNIYPINLQFFAGEKTEKATPKRRQKARSEGQVAKSQEVAAALILLAIFLLFLILGKSMGQRMFYLFQNMFSHYLLFELTQDSVKKLTLDMAYQGAMIAGPVLLVGVIVALAASYAQVGTLFTTEPLKFKLDRLDPIKGTKRLFSLQAVVTLIKSLLKVGSVGLVAWFVIWGAKGDLLTLATKSIGDMITVMARLTLELGFAIGLLLLILAMFDYFFQKYEYEKNLKMSKQDIKDEYKMSEGDPQIKGKIKQRQREMAMRRMMQEVPKADVVITNPTHFAIAIQYKPEERQAPVVIAKGQDFVALKIKDAAKQHGVITMENKPLARTLYANVEINQEIPEDLFQAVAEILAYVYRLKGKIR
ncbi:flagellar biosynthesis protein FlhB [Aneurinibacillus sp. Ricciae_BoGa-3]|uniref:flagellar biosynthesis protein FlhB n=1 Tax=Aneurinibacillus sp. Ricciae_BoGa-3 TaxID=3022697 RepID=UPI002340F864|nr:flagellar biosynthesis protein FlhB [Aneurinibacillus sp. Ricciae_BoGa-3]WCK52882.1 flagellar biosynthesis protein FlhB [Aneurinibacillus sp. Ricciae_BoGa-3]